MARRLLAVALAATTLSGCGSAMTGTWQKPGADPQTVGRDTSSCRSVARSEAVQQYPDRFGSPAPFGVPSSQQQNDLSRSAYEASRFETCMTGLGYQRV